MQLAKVVYLLLALIGRCSSSDVLGPGKIFLQREAAVFLSHVEQAFATEVASVKAKTVAALKRFFREIAEWHDAGRGFQIYTLAHTIRSAPDNSYLAVFHRGTVGEFFPPFAVKILQQVNVDLMSVDGIIDEDRRIVLARLFGLARRYGLDVDEISALMSLPLGALGLKMERVLDLETEGSVSVELGLAEKVILTNPSLGRFLTLLRVNLAPRITQVDFEDVSRFDYLIYTGWNNHRLEFLYLVNAAPAVGEGIWRDENVLRMLDALSDIVETLPYIRTYEENLQSRLSAALDALINTLRSGDISPRNNNFEELAARTQSSVGLFRTEANKDGLKLLRDRIVSHVSGDGKISIIPKLVKYVDRASMLVHRISVVPDSRFSPRLKIKEKYYNRIVTLVTAVVDASLSIVENPTNHPLVGLADVLARVTIIFHNMAKTDIKNHYLDTIVLETAFVFYRRFGISFLTKDFLPEEWTQERVKAIRSIMKSFLIFGESEWTKLLTFGVSLSTRSKPETFDTGFVAHIFRVPQERLETAVVFIARQALWRMKMDRAGQFHDAPLVSPAEWLKLYIGQWADGRFTTAPSRNSRWELELPVIAPVAMVGEINGGMYSDLQREIASYLLDTNHPKELVMLAKEISSVQADNWSRITGGDHGSALRSISDIVLSLPRHILQVEAEQLIMEGEKYRPFREMLVQAVRSLSSALIVAATTQNVDVENIKNIKRCSASLVYVLDYLISAENAVLLRDWSVKWTGRSVLGDKFDDLRNLIGGIGRVQADIQSAQVTEGLCRRPDPMPTRYIHVPFL